jgi:hypothetical protein
LILTYISCIISLRFAPEFLSPHNTKYVLWPEMHSLVLPCLVVTYIVWFLQICIIFDN